MLFSSQGLSWLLFLHLPRQQYIIMRVHRLHIFAKHRPQKNYKQERRTGIIGCFSSVWSTSENRCSQGVFTNPSSSLFLSNWSLASALVNISAICFFVEQKFIEIQPFSTLSLRKWCRMSICFVLFCWHGFLAILIALVLSQKIGMHPVSTQRSLSCCRIHNNWAQHEATATYSASAVDMATECCFLVAQDTKQGPRKWAIPEVLFLSTRNPLL